MYKTFCNIVAYLHIAYLKFPTIFQILHNLLPVWKYAFKLISLVKLLFHVSLPVFNFVFKLLTVFMLVYRLFPSFHVTYQVDILISTVYKVLLLIHLACYVTGPLIRGVLRIRLVYKLLRNIVSIILTCFCKIFAVFRKKADGNNSGEDDGKPNGHKGKCKDSIADKDELAPDRYEKI